MTRRRVPRRLVALGLAVVAVAGFSLASASQLAINGTVLQAGTGVVPDCQPASQVIGTSFTSAFSAGAYRTTAVTLSNVASTCTGLTYRLQLVAADGTPLDVNGGAAGTDVSGSVTLSGGAFTVAVTSTPTASIARVALVIAG